LKTILLVFLLSTSALAADRHVSPIGSDTNDGTFAAPFKTLAKCEAALLGGDTCYVHAGTYPLPFSPTSVVGNKTMAQYGTDIVDLKLMDGSTLRFTGDAVTWDSPDLSLVQMMTMGRFGSGPPPAGLIYVELYIDGALSSVSMGPALPLLLNYPLTIPKSPKGASRAIQIRVHQ
jgi:hypothetical protein